MKKRAKNLKKSKNLKFSIKKSIFDLNKSGGEKRRSLLFRNEIYGYFEQEFLQNEALS